MKIAREEHTRPDYWRVIAGFLQGPEAFYRSLPQKKDVAKIKSQAVCWLLYEKPRRDARAFTSAIFLEMAKKLIERDNSKALNAYFKAIEWPFAANPFQADKEASSSALAVLYQVPSTLILDAAVQPKELFKIVRSVDKNPFAYPDNWRSFDAPLGVTEDGEEIVRDVAYAMGGIEEDPQEMSPADQEKLWVALLVIQSNQKRTLFWELVSQGMTHAEAAKQAGLGKRALQDMKRQTKRILQETPVRQRDPGPQGETAEETSKHILSIRKLRRIFRLLDAGWSASTILDEIHKRSGIVASYYQDLDPYSHGVDPKKVHASRTRDHGHQYHWNDPNKGLQEPNKGLPDSNEGPEP